MQVLSIPWTDSTVVPCAKVHTGPWVTVHFAQGTAILGTEISLGTHVHTLDTHSRNKITLF